jgi:RNA polymerase sigma factor (sigma-70 family)
MNDEEAIKLAKHGRQEGFKALFDNHADYLYSNALRILRNPTMAEDAVQETLTAAFRGIETFKGQSRLRTWLYKIMYRNSLRIIEKNKPIDFKEHETTTEAAVQSVDKRLDIEAVMGLMTPRERSVLMLAYKDDLPLKEVAQILEITENNAKIVLFRARKRFAELWEKHIEREGKNEL